MDQTTTTAETKPAATPATAKTAPETKPDPIVLAILALSKGESRDVQNEVRGILGVALIPEPAPIVRKRRFAKEQA